LFSASRQLVGLKRELSRERQRRRHRLKQHRLKQHRLKRLRHRSLRLRCSCRTWGRLPRLIRFLR